MILKPDSIKTIDPYCRILTFNNFDLNSTDLDLLIKEGRSRSKCLPITISIEEGDVSGTMYYDRYKEITNLYFLVYDLKNIDYVDYELTAQDTNSKKSYLTGRVTANYMKGYNEDESLVYRKALFKILMPTKDQVLSLKGKMTFKITLTEKFITDNLLIQIEKANVVVPFSSFLCKDAFENFLNETDFIIKCEGQEFHFNKTLLCLVSEAGLSLDPYFRRKNRYFWLVLVQFAY